MTTDIRRFFNLSQAFKPISVGRIFGIPVQLNWSWFVIFALHVWAVASLHLPRVAPGHEIWQYWLTAIAMTVVLLSSIFAHELAHSLMAKTEGIGITNITLHIFGGVSHLERESPNPLTDFRIAIVGPGSSFLIGIILYVISRVGGGASQSLLLFHSVGYLAFVNLALAAFNLLPGFPLDGGRVLRAYLWHRKKNYQAATLAACRAGRNIALLLMFTGVIFGLRERHYLTILWSLFVGLFLKDVADSSARQLTAHTGPRRVGDVMSPPSEISPELLLSELVERLKTRNAPTRYPVVVERRLHGILALEQVREIPPERWSTVRAREVMRPVDASLFINQSASLADGLRRVSRNGLNFAAVLDNEGYVVGVVSGENLK